MNNSPDDNFSAIKENRIFLFWMAMKRCHDYRDRDIAEATKWMDIAWNQIDFDKLSLFDFEFDGKDVDSEWLDNESDWIMQQYGNKVNSRESDEVRKSIRRLLELHSTSAFLYVKPDQNPLAYIILIFLVLIYAHKKKNQDPSEWQQEFEDSFTDDNVELLLDEMEKESKQARNKKTVIASLYNHFYSAIPGQTEYVYHTLIGLSCVSLGLLDSEDQHYESKRISSFQEYLRNDVKGVINRMSNISNR